jgi:hypothetical protein
MAMGGGAGLRHKKVMPPSTMAASSAPAIAEAQCQRTGAGWAGTLLVAGAGGTGFVGMGVLRL